MPHHCDNKNKCEICIKVKKFWEEQINKFDLEKALYEFLLRSCEEDFFNYINFRENDLEMPD